MRGDFELVEESGDHMLWEDRGRRRRRQVYADRLLRDGVWELGLQVVSRDGRVERRRVVGEYPDRGSAAEAATERDHEFDFS